MYCISDNNGDGINRRSVLKNSIGAGLGAAGLVQPAIATRETTSDEIDWARSQPQVQLILDELGYDSFPEQATAETKELDTDKFDMKLVSIDLGYGKLNVGKVGDKTDASFYFNEDAASGGVTLPAIGVEPPGSTETAPRQKYQNLPQGADAWLLASEDETTFLRTATQTERQNVLTAIPGENHDETMVYTRSDLDGFQVDVFNSDDEPETASMNNPEVSRYRVTPKTGAMSAAQPATSEFVFNNAEVEQLASPEFISRWGKEAAKELAQDLGFSTLDAILDSCGPDVAECVATMGSKIIGCTRCAPPCAGSPSGVGAVVCFLCVFGFCSQLLSAVPCANAAACVGD